MTDQPHDDLTPLEERLNNAAQIVPHSEQAQMEILGILEGWYAHARDNDDAPLQAALITIMSRTDQLTTHVMEQAILLNSVVIAMHTLRKQRDAALDELDTIEQGLANIWMTQHPKLKQVYSQVAESHNADFWESLPYDMAAVLGDDWQQWDADTLYAAVTADIDEVDEDGDYYGFTRDQLIAFRENLHQQIIALAKGEYNHAVE